MMKSVIIKDGAADVFRLCVILFSICLYIYFAIRAFPEYLFMFNKETTSGRVVEVFDRAMIKEVVPHEAIVYEFDAGDEGLLSGRRDVPKFMNELKAGDAIDVVYSTWLPGMNYPSDHRPYISFTISMCATLGLAIYFLIKVVRVSKS